MICSTENCGREVRTKGLCSRCYSRQYRAELRKRCPPRPPRTVGSGYLGTPSTPLAARLKQLRLDAGLLQHELEPRLGSAKNRICDWELGVRTPTLDSLQKYAKAFDTTVSKLLEGIM